MMDTRLDIAIAARVAANEALASANRDFYAALKEEAASALAEREKVVIAENAVNLALKMLRQAQKAEVEARRST